MKEDSFAKMVNQIGAEADAEKRAELEAQLRRARWAKTRRLVLLLVMLGITVAAFVNRAQISEQWQTVLTKTGINQTNEIAAKSGKNLKEIQATAAKRDALLDNPLGK